MSKYSSYRHWQITILNMLIIVILLLVNSNHYLSASYSVSYAATKKINRLSTTQSTPVQTSSLAKSDATILTKAKPIQRELKGGELHNYTITMEANQYLNAIVEQQGINIIATIFDPDGQKIYEIDSPNGEEGPEPIYLITEKKGAYRLEIRSLEKMAKPAKYQAKIVELRTPVDQDSYLVTGYKAVSEAVQLSLAGSSEHINQIITKYEEAAASFSIADASLPEASTLDLLARLYRNNRADYVKAERFLQRALLLRDRVLGPDNLLTLTSMINLADNYQFKGEAAKADAIYQRALKLLEKNLESQYSVATESLLATALISLANNYQAQADYNSAEPLYKKALAIREKMVGPSTNEVAIILSRLAANYEKSGDTTQVGMLYQRALTIREKLFGDEHPEIIKNLDELAGFYNYLGFYEKAEPLYQRSIKLLEKTLGAQHPLLALKLTNLANFYRNKGDYNQAIQVLERALAISDNAYVALTYKHLALAYRAKEDINQAIKYSQLANDARERELVKHLVVGSEQEKLSYLNLTAFELDQIISLHLIDAPNNREAAQLALTGILRRKGRALDVMTDSIANLRRRANKEDQLLLDQLANARTQYAILSLKGPDKALDKAVDKTVDKAINKEDIAQYQTILKALADQIETLEKHVSSRSAEFSIQSQTITLNAVQQVIAENATLIEFVAYYQYDKKNNLGSRHYAVYLLNKSGEPLFAALGDAKLIDEAIIKLRDLLSNRASDIDKELKPAARALDQLIMQPVRKLLGDKQRLLISAYGPLNLVAFDALVDENNRYLVEQFEISYLTSGRDLLRLQNGIKANQPPLVIADANFGEGPGPKVGQLSFEPLKRLTGSAEEASEIKKEFNSVNLLLQDKATRSALIEAHRPIILHIATYGFFLDNESTNLNEAQRIAIRKKIEQESSNPAIGTTEMSRESIGLANPLLRSGLFFANANTQEENATVTALEVAGLDLWGTKLVVLSAGNTGMGEIRSGDGIYGLRRALVLAGAETQVISLWPVSDQGTKDLMVAYYEALKQGEGRSVALRKVRLSFLAKPDRAHPYYWASFIQSGEWANLDGKR